VKKVIQAAKRWLTRKKAPKLPLLTIPQSEHHICLTDLNARAIDIIQTLNRAGHDAYIVGGGIRDALIGLHPKDFDIATNAYPEVIRKLFRNSRIIGRRFRLIHIFFGKEVIEVATFRSQHVEKHRSAHGFITRDNEYGTIEDDALRRDFTINALYYDARQQVILDYVGGFQDLQNKVIHLIGNAENRYREDPVRMLRAIRFAAKTNFQLEASTAEWITPLAPLLKHIAAARLYEEFRKLFFSGYALTTLHLLQQYQLFQCLFDSTHQLLRHPDYQHSIQLMLEKACADTDLRIAEGKRVTNAFFIAAALWYPFVKHLNHSNMEAAIPPQRVLQAAKAVLSHQHQQTTMPAYVSSFVQDIWFFQFRLTRLRAKYAANLIPMRPFRAAFDFLMLRAFVAKKLALTNPSLHAEAKKLDALVKFWEEFQHANPEDHTALLKKFPGQLYVRKKKKKVAPAPSDGDVPTDTKDA